MELGKDLGLAGHQGILQRVCVGPDGETHRASLIKGAPAPVGHGPGLVAHGSILVPECGSSWTKAGRQRAERCYIWASVRALLHSHDRPVDGRQLPQPPATLAAPPREAGGCGSAHPLAVWSGFPAPKGRAPESLITGAHCLRGSQAFSGAADRDQVLLRSVRSSEPPDTYFMQIIASHRVLDESLSC